MNAFDKVIGYKATKRELLQLCDMLRNREIYEEMGARLPHGLLLYGDPGLGKTLLARCFVEESGLLHQSIVFCHPKRSFSNRDNLSRFHFPRLSSVA